MSNLITPTVQLLHPSYVEPGLVLAQSQASGAFEALGGTEPLVRLSNTTRQVYVKRADIRTRIQQAQSAGNMLPSVDVQLDMDGTAAYLQRIRQGFDHHDADMASEWGVGILDVFRYGTRQAHFQGLRNALLHGVSPQLGEGLLNTVGATRTTLPVDSNKNSTVSSYDPNESFTFWLNEIADLKVRTNQVGTGRRIVMIAPQRVVAQYTIRQVIQLTQWQRQGAGSNVVAGSLSEVLSMGDDEFQMQCDDTLIGAGANGTDAIMLTMPEIEVQEGRIFNTNEFAKLAPNLTACNLQFINTPMPIEILSPIESGRTDFLSEMRLTSGWSVRPEAVTIVSAPFN